MNPFLATKHSQLNKKIKKLKSRPQRTIIITKMNGIMFFKNIQKILATDLE